MSGWCVHYTVVTLLLLAGLLSESGWAQNTAGSDQETMPQLAQQIKELQKQANELQQHIKMLETGKAQDASPPETAVIDSSPQADGVMGAVQAWHDTHGIQWRGFGEVNYKVLDQRKPELGTYGFVPGSAGNFYTGDFDLFLSARVSDKASFLSEIAFGEGDHQTFGVDLERFLLQYESNDHLKISLGRYQTGIGYYNTEFRSTKWLQTTADRPLVMEFAVDGGLLPTQAVGVSITGHVPSGKLGLSYLVEYGSSDTVRPDINGSGSVDDEDNGNHVLVGLFVRPDWLQGLRVGTSFYHDKIGDSSVPHPTRYGQTIVNGHVVYVAHRIEFLAEGFLIRHTPEHRNLVFNMPAFYVQLSKQFGHIRPFFRYEYANANKEDTIFDDVGLRYGSSFGARYDLNESIAFKLQLNHTDRTDMPDLNGLQTQIAFTF